MRTIIKLVLIVIAAVVGYNYFFGNSHERTESREIVDQMKDLGKSIFDLVKNEKERMEQGKYDGIFDKMETIFDNLEEQLDSTDETQKEELEQLEKDKQDLKEKVREAEENEMTEEARDQIDLEIRDLLRKTERLLKRTKDD